MNDLEEALEAASYTARDDMHAFAADAIEIEAVLTSTSADGDQLGLMGSRRFRAESGRCQL